MSSSPKSPTEADKVSAGVKGESKSKIFVGGLKPCTTSDCLREHFSKYGKVFDAEVMMKKDEWAGVKKSRNFGFVIFDDEESVRNALAEGHEIDDRVVEVKKADPDAKPRAAPTENINTDKIFVGGLNQDVDKDALNVYFETFGPIVDAQVMLDRETGRSRGFGFIRFVEKDSVRKVMEKFQDHEIGGKWIECKPAVPQSDKGKGKGGGKSGKGKGKGKGRDHYNHHHESGKGGHQMGGDPYGGYGQQAGYGGYGGHQGGGYDANAGYYQQHPVPGSGGNSGYDQYGQPTYGPPPAQSYQFGGGYGGAPPAGQYGYQGGSYPAGSPAPQAGYGQQYGSPDPNAAYGNYGGGGGAVQDQNTYGPGRTRGASGMQGGRANPY